MSHLKITIQDEVKNAMRAKDRERLNTLRSMTAAIKQVEIDERKELTDDDIVTILDKMVKQRRESIEQFKKADRQDLIAVELMEIEHILLFLPDPLSTEEITVIVKAAIEQTEAKTMKDMGKILEIIRPKLNGKADMGEVSTLIKGLLG